MFKQHVERQRAAESKQFAERLAASRERWAKESAKELAEWHERFGDKFKPNPVDFVQEDSSQAVSVNLNKRLDEMHADRPFFIGEMHLEPDPAEGVRLKIGGSLYDGLWMQLARKLSSKTVIRTCRYCGSTFEAGAGSKRRADATFCCSEHSVRFHSLNRLKG